MRLSSPDAEPGRKARSLKARPDDRSLKTWGLPVALALHLLLLLGLDRLPSSRKAVAPLDEGMPIEILTEESPGTLQSERAPPAAPPGAGAAAMGDPAIAPDQGKSGLPGMTRATTIRSAEVLSHPLSRKMVAALASMEEETRWEQLCGIEAMAQIAAAPNGAFQPDRVVAYAMADVKASGGEILAEGAAFRSRGRWYRLKFQCRLKPDRLTVETFEFSVGKAIPRRLWEAHNLPPRY